jgi:predicted nucleic acid-binding OB-fold protein
MQRKMREHRLAKMHGTGKKILREVLRNARDARAFNSIFGGEQTIVGRDKMDAVIRY